MLNAYAAADIAPYAASRSYLTYRARVLLHWAGGLASGHARRLNRRLWLLQAVSIVWATVLRCAETRHDTNLVSKLAVVQDAQANKTRAYASKNGEIPDESRGRGRALRHDGLGVSPARRRRH